MSSRFALGLVLKSSVRGVPEGGHEGPGSGVQPQVNFGSCLVPWEEVEACSCIAQSRSWPGGCGATGERRRVAHRTPVELRSPDRNAGGRRSRPA